jgi:hypothetical protein
MLCLGAHGSSPSASTDRCWSGGCGGGGKGRRRPASAWRCAVGRRSGFVGIDEGFSFYRAAKQRTRYLLPYSLRHECSHKLDIYASVRSEQ